MVKFMTSTIKVGKSPSFQEIVERKMKKEEIVKTAKVEDASVVKTAEAKETVKVAAKEEAEAKSSGQPEAEGKLVNGPKVEKEDGAKKETKKAKDEEIVSSGQLDVEPLHQKGESVKPSAITGDNKKTEAKNTATFVKVAKLNPKTREMLKAYWKNLYPADYVEAMLSEN